MKSIWFNRFCIAFAALIALIALIEISATAQTITFSNAAAPRAIPRRASIILIVANGLGYGDLSCYGQTKFQTPNLDKLAADGVRFTNFFGENEISKSRTELMFGKNSGPDEMSVAQILKNSGYHTGLIGEWTLGDENSSTAPWKKGFDEFAGYLDDNDAKNFYADYIFRYAPKTVLGSNGDAPHFVVHEMLYYNTGGKHGTYVPDLLTKAAINFAKNNQPDAFNHHRPFFLTLNYRIPGDGSSRPPSDAPYSEEPWPQPEKNKAALISQLDGYIGQLREQLKNLGMTNNVAIFLTSDTISKKANGVDPDFFHSNISTNDFRVPMIVCWPENISTGQVSDLKCSANDFLPTAAEIGFAKAPEKIDGKAVLTELRGK